ncbi:heparan-alpha-glucosaminide N-acetyltransferase isoform X3 [Oryzias latipes]|uniref:heparan-alpha-glucosaminide N-acetyltransferase isoform X3 n=1 Tax=Oryzias latipes TaxID=8090 RepID=UPI0005CBD292|nr:heparan-alpha-glucosaminide N-acetyltransferase isoform X3 [Oryzias latipes]
MHTPHPTEPNMSGSAVCVLTFGRGYMAVSGIKTSSRTGAFCSRNIMDSGRALCAVLAALLLISSGSAGTIQTALKINQALLTFHNQLTEEVQVSFTSDYCYKCLFQHLASVTPNNNNASVIISTQFSLTVQVESGGGSSTLCRWRQTYQEGGHYSVWIQARDHLVNHTCSHSTDRPPHNVYLPIIAAALLLAATALLFVVVPLIHRRRGAFLRAACCQDPQNSVDDDGAPETAVVAADSRGTRPARLLSLDTFRGFALTVMVFVNYGGGGYWFFEHAPWNGLTVADLVMPWFVFIMGTSVVLAFSSMQRRGVGRRQLLGKITWRTVVLMLLGFCFLNYSPRDGPLSWSWLRIPGVLQRLAFTYFVLSLLQTFWGRKAIPESENHWWNPVQDVVLFWPQWLLIFLLETLWLCITFLMPVPNCPTGYLGAGGIGDHGLYPNCTGGAAGSIDRWMFGDNMYRYPTCKKLYRTEQPYDPEGVLGTINSIVMGFLGMQAGKIIVFYKRKSGHILWRYLTWAVILGISAAILSKCTRDGGFIPVNKNLWSLSYVTCTGALSFLLLGGMYFLIDVRGWWGGQPFLYPGMNSILVYVGHSLLGFYFPFSWNMRFQDSHWEFLFQGVWGTSLWVLAAYLLYRKAFFLRI